MKRLNWLKFALPVAFGLAVGVAGLGWVVVYLPQLQTAPLSQKIKGYETSAKPDPEKLATLEKGRLDSESAIRAGLIQGLGGAVLLIGLFFTYRNLQVAEDKLVTDRFSKAADMLSSSSMHTRLGGIYALERIANDSDQDYWQVMEVLSAFVREESPYPPKSKDSEAEGTVEARQPALVVVPELEEEPGELPVVESEARQRSDSEQSKLERVIQQQQKLRQLEQKQKQKQQEQEEFVATLPTLRTDIEAAMTVIGRRKHRYGEGEWKTQRLYLHQTDLRKLKASEANLTGVILFKAHLEGAWLLSAHLERANLIGVHLEGADLRRAHLEEAELDGAHLEKADLRGTHLEKVILSEAHLEKADLSGAHLDGANLSGASLKGAFLFKAHLEKADLSGANLRSTVLSGASLGKAKLFGADLKGTNLSEVCNLTQQQINSALTDEDTILPPGLHRQPSLRDMLPYHTSIAPPTTSPAPTDTET